MKKEIVMTVCLKVPDTTAITALQTLLKMGYKNIADVKRHDYYKFFIEGNPDDFMKKISKVDILVNANKHVFSFDMQKNDYIKILVRNTDDTGDGLLSTLKNRLCFKNIAKIEKGILWNLSINSDTKNALKIAEKAAKELLVNENYQEYSIL